MRVFDALTDRSGSYDYAEGIDWQDKEKRSEGLKLIGESAQEAYNNVDEAFKGIKGDIDELRKYATTEEQQIALDEVLRLAKADTDAARERINQNLNEVYSAIQLDLIKGYKDVIIEAHKNGNK